MKKIIIIIAIVVAAIIGLLAYYKFLPFWATIVSTGAFIAGGVAGWLTKGLFDKFTDLR